MISRITSQFAEMILTSNINLVIEVLISKKNMNLHQHSKICPKVFHLSSAVYLDVVVQIYLLSPFVINYGRNSII